MSPLLSLIIPCHNDGEKLPRLFNSILAQSFKNLEVVLVDDCSDISCTDILEAYRGKGLHIKFEAATERLFTKKARLRGVQVAAGQIIMFADADDILWGTEALARNIDLFLTHNADILHFPTIITDQSGNFSRYFHCADPLAPQLNNKDILASFMQSDWEGCVIWNKLFDRQLWLNNLAEMLNNPVVRYSEDLFLNIYAFMHAKRYIGSEHIGYGFYCVNAKYTERYIHNAMICTKMLELMPPRLHELDFSGEVIQSFKQQCAKWVCLFTGRTANTAPKDENGIPTNAAVQRLLDIGDHSALLKALLLGSGINARRLTAIYKEITELR